MSAPRLVVCGLEPGPAVALAAGALLAAFADERAVRPVLLGADLPLWRLLFGASSRTPRVLDPRLVGRRRGRRAATTRGRRTPTSPPSWPSSRRSTAGRASEGSRAVDVAAALDAPLVLVVDARDRGATAAAAACGARAARRQRRVRRDHRRRRRRPGRRRPSCAASWRRAPGCRCSGGCRRSSASSSRASTAAARTRCARSVRSRSRVERRRSAGRRPATSIARASRRRPRAAASCRRGRAACSRPCRPPPASRSQSPGGRRSSRSRSRRSTSSRRWDSRSSRSTSAATRRCRRARPACSSPACSTRRSCRRSPATTRSRSSLAAAINGGLPTLALGGGALLLLRRLADSRGRTHELAGVLPAEAELLEWYERPRYVHATRGTREPVCGGRGHPVRALRPRVPDPSAGGLRLARRRGRTRRGRWRASCMSAASRPRSCLPCRRRPSLAASFVAAMRLAAPGE